MLLVDEVPDPGDTRDTTGELGTDPDRPAVGCHTTERDASLRDADVDAEGLAAQRLEGVQHVRMDGLVAAGHRPDEVTPGDDTGQAALAVGHREPLDAPVLHL